MAEDAPAKAAGKGLGFLGQKAGPLPIGVWLLAAAVIWWYTQKKTAGPGGTPGTTGYATDPAGNVGVLNPETGYVYGSPSDQAAIQANWGPSQEPAAATGFANDADWGNAALNFLLSMSIDPTTASAAISAYLAGQQLTADQQKLINEAIQSIGAPPKLPSTASTPTTPPPVPAPTGTGQVSRFPAPTGAKVAGVTASSVSLQWNDTPGKDDAGKTVYPQSYTVRIWQLNNVVASETSVTAPNTRGTLTQTTVAGLHTKFSYKAQIWANGGKNAPPGANVTFTLK